MKSLEFNICYHTQWGETVEIVCAFNDEKPQAVKMQTADGTHWTAQLDAPDNTLTVRHAYRITNEEGLTLRSEHNSWRFFHIEKRNHVRFTDVWTEEHTSDAFHHAPFSPAMMIGQHRNESVEPLLSSSHLLILTSPPIPEGKHWAVCGSTPDLGNWETPQVMHRTSPTEWVFPISNDDAAAGFDYKYLITNTASAPEWETGDNRSWPAQPDLKEGLPHFNVVRADNLPRSVTPQWKAAGVVMPVFSLLSGKSWGVGDFADLLTFVRWAADCGMKAVQLLPINDTTTNGSWRDSYPYNCVSVFALHPIYLSPSEWTDTRAFKQCEAEGKKLNALGEVDYEQAFALKMRFAHALFKELGKEITQSKAFKDFCNEEAAWLENYASFCTLRTFHHTANFRQWPSDSTDAFGMDKDRLFHKFLQFLLHRQMLHVHDEATALGVMLKGDIPIGISPDSAPAWKDHRLFHFDGQAGAPPDDFATRGQNWGFPTYNWEEMAKDGYAWWRRRLAHMGRYFDAYRIDHVLGFFRIWEVPTQHIYGVLGHFRPALPFTEKEIRSFGFDMPMELATHPLISQERMDELCHAYGADKVKPFFTATRHGLLLKEEYESQRKIEALDIDGALKEELLDTATEVFFVVDPDRPDNYHPRVSAQLTRRFHDLEPSQRDAFNRLHDDFFYFRHNEFWREEAMRKMPAIVNYPFPPTPQGQAPTQEIAPTTLFPLHGTGMLPCAEDLGMVPACVKGVLEDLDILSLEIQRMPKAWGHRFGVLAANPYLSVSTIATHDMPPLRLWWKENREQTIAFWQEALGHSGEAPEEASPEVCEEVVKAHLESPSMFCLLSFQDFTAISPTLRNPHPEREQINVPANPDQYWRYRMHLPLEALISNSGFSEKLHALIRQSGR